MAFFGYDSYQDVRKNLFYYSTPFLICAGFFAYFLILPGASRTIVNSLLQRITTNQLWKGVLGTSSGIVVFGVVSFLLTEVFQVHDQFYDKYIIKWRKSYAIDFIQPRLIRPVASKVHARFYQVIKEKVGDFQERLYYPFVGDRDTKIPKNKLVRFYEVITVYWLTQINEIVIWLLTITVTIFALLKSTTSLDRVCLLRSLLIIAGAFILNRLWRISSLAKVRDATEEEIDAIHGDRKLLRDLQTKIKTMCDDYKIPYKK